ncbi:MAG: 1-acyl-sn-glycerol-3-phosphate acyltransferase [Spirochaetes bacterium]|nr:1-acyl-sn-glycerol-3-phosphate acyltransferase [Spirochaetota bacterium]
MLRVILTYFLSALGAIILYEIIRFVIKEKVMRRLYRSVRAQIKRYDIKLDKYKFMNKFIVKQEIMNDQEIRHAILNHASDNNLDFQEVDELVDQYIEEIVPFFNLLSYYKIGYWISNFFLNALYEVVIDRENAEKLGRIPKDAAVVFVMNHRSNVDYVLVAYMLARNISISYAVGEWARVWPLEYIFKSFGAYFLRRQYREKLYHLVLEKYIQMISLHGVTQGIFIEGGLTRDGQFRDSKIGLLDYIVKIKSNPEFKQDIVFVPVGINYDWVLEDRVLIREWKENKEKSGFRDNITSLARILLKTPFVLVLNLIRYVTGRLKRHGYASVSFGDPVPVSQFLSSHKNFFSLDRSERLRLVKKFADELLDRIGDVVPVTPVCLTAYAILSIGRAQFDRSELIQKIIEINRLLREQKRRIVIGRAFASYRNAMEHLEDEKSSRKKELVSFEEDFLSVNEARNMARIALDILARRGIIILRRSTIMIHARNAAYLEYYSNLLTLKK